ncbi:MAG: STAS domain-containing protein [Spirochaetia bacterium]
MKSHIIKHQSNNNDIVSGFDDESDDSIRLMLQKIEGMEGVLVIFASGYIDTYNSLGFQRRTEKVVKAGFVRLVIDMSAVNYVSSTGVGALTNLLKLVKPQNGDIVLLNIQPKIFEVLELLGFSKYFQVMENFDESRAYFTRNFETNAFPKVFRCPSCSKLLRAVKAGRFRCSECKTILTIDNNSYVEQGATK